MISDVFEGSDRCQSASGRILRLRMPEQHHSFLNNTRNSSGPPSHEKATVILGGDSDLSCLVTMHLNARTQASHSKGLLVNCPAKGTCGLKINRPSQYRLPWYK
jgi:hypothetical protein